MTYLFRLEDVQVGVDAARKVRDIRQTFQVGANPFGPECEQYEDNPASKKRSHRPYLPLATALGWEPEAARRGVSKVARSARGFMRAYEKAGSAKRLADAWKRKREGFVSRHFAQAEASGEPWFEPDGSPTRRHLALIMWAYSPEPRRLTKQKQNANPVEGNPVSKKAKYNGMRCDGGLDVFLNGYLVDHAKEVSYRTFAKNVDVRSFEVGRLGSCDHCTFLRSRLPSGVEAWVLQWSGFEHLAVDPSIPIDFDDEARVAMEADLSPHGEPIVWWDDRELVDSLGGYAQMNRKYQPAYTKHVRYDREAADYVIQTVAWLVPKQDIAAAVALGAIAGREVPVPARKDTWQVLHLTQRVYYDEPERGLFVARDNPVCERDAEVRVTDKGQELWVRGEQFGTFNGKSGWIFDGNLKRKQITGKRSWNLALRGWYGLESPSMARPKSTKARRPPKQLAAPEQPKPPSLARAVKAHDVYPDETRGDPYGAWILYDQLESVLRGFGITLRHALYHDIVAIRDKRVGQPRLGGTWDGYRVLKVDVLKDLQPPAAFEGNPVRRPKADLPLVEIEEYGKRFATGEPVTFEFFRGKEPAPKMGASYQQDIEPAGRYMIHLPKHMQNVPSGMEGKYESGTVTFRNPLVLAMTRDEHVIYGPKSWKAALHRWYGKKGKALSRAIVRDGYDGIVTVWMVPKGGRMVPGDVREIVDLTWLRDKIGADAALKAIADPKSSAPRSAAISLLADMPDATVAEVISAVRSHASSGGIYDPVSREMVSAAAVIKELGLLRPKAIRGKNLIDVYHATDMQSAQTLLAKGFIPEMKPMRLVQQYAPRSGADRGLYVGASPRAVESYGRVILRVRVPESHLAVPTELSQVGVTDPMEALSMHDGAVISRPIPPSEFAMVHSNPVQSGATAPLQTELAAYGTFLQWVIDISDRGESWRVAAALMAIPAKYRSLGLRDLFPNMLRDYEMSAEDRKVIERAARSTARRSLRVKPAQANDVYLREVAGFAEFGRVAAKVIGSGNVRLARTCPVVGGFRLVNAGGFNTKVLSVAMQVVQEASDKLKDAGFESLIYGDVNVVGSITAGKSLLAHYDTGTDEVYIRANLRGRTGPAVRTVLHELAHRLEFKFMVDRQQRSKRGVARESVVRLYRRLTDKYEQILADAVWDRANWPKPGEHIGQWVVKGVSLGPRGARIEVSHPESDEIVGHAPLESYVRQKLSPTAVFVSRYASTDPSENFAEMVTEMCLGSLSADNEKMLMQTINEGLGL